EHEKDEEQEEQVQQQEKKEKARRSKRKVRGSAEPQRRTAFRQPAADNPTTLKGEQPLRSLCVQGVRGRFTANENPTELPQVLAQGGRRPRGTEETQRGGGILPGRAGPRSFHGELPQAQDRRPQRRLIQAPAEVPGTKGPCG
ncbi:unnamed protein product, partial [Ectocarpus sp. 6 AP-2014]